MDKMLYEVESLLIKVLGNSPKTRIIDFMMDNPLFDFTKKQMYEAMGMSKRTLYKALPDLERNGIIKVSRRIGRSKLYKINLEHKLIRALLEFENELSLQEAEEAHM